MDEKLPGKTSHCTRSCDRAWVLAEMQLGDTSEAQCLRFGMPQDIPEEAMDKSNVLWIRF